VLAAVMTEAKGNRAEAARWLEIDAKTLRKMLKDYDLGGAWTTARATRESSGAPI
jgi:DNA-binding NtrC family response regulator